MKKLGRRKRCPSCGSLNVQRWGKRDNLQRYRCKDCGGAFTPHRDDVTLSNRFPLFKKWVLGKRSLEELSKECGYSERQIRRWFDEYLDKPPKWVIRRADGISMLIDDTWFGDRCLIVYRDQTNTSTLYYRFSDREDKFEISKDLEMFKEIGLKIHSFTTDGSEDIIRAIKWVYPYVIRQRCLVHIERDCLVWLTKHPRTSAGITLRRLACKISDIKTNNDKIFWIRKLNEWYDEYEEFIKEKSVNQETGELTYTHAKVRQTYVLLKKAIPNMFKYIDHPEVPTNTNGIESFFGHLKDNLRIHRGLSKEHHENFIKWYLFFSNERKRGEKIALSGDG